MQPLLELPDQTLPDEIDEEILDLFVEEVNKVLEVVTSSFTVWNTNPDNTEALKTLRHNFHSLKSIGRLVGAMVIGELGWKLENLLNQVIEGTIPTNNAILFLIDKVINLLPNMVEQVKNHQPTPYEVRLLISQVHHLSETQGQSMGEFATPEEKTTVLQVNLNPEPATEFANPNPESRAEAQPEPELPEGEIQFSELFSPSEIEFLSQVEIPFEIPLEELLPLDDMQFEEIPSAPLSMEEHEDDQQALIDNIQMAVESLPKIVSKSPETSPPPAEPVVPDATDEFMAMFLDEAEEILEEMQSLLERRRATPHNLPLGKLQRQLHTLKGGARMVGISAMGDLSHSLESVLGRLREGGVESNLELQEIVQKSVDELAAMLEAVRSGVPLDMPTDLIASINKIMGEIIPTPAPPPAPTPPPTPVPEPKDTTRVPDVLIDKLTHLVRELSISHAQLEQQQGAVKNTLSEMEQAVARLRDRDQLRRLEIETEAQILSHYTQILSQLGIDQKDFDPLELDRFSVMKQLSRRLLESIISDLLNIQDTLKILTPPMDSLLLQQARIGAELHDAIMQTRLIPFSRISPRLQRTVRLTARELRKQVDFIINGEQIKFERTLLNRLIALLEHILKNVFYHGIEDATTRQQAGKPAVAKITLDISKEGTELILKLRDDGAELDLSAIRKRAEELDWIKPDTVISDDELMQFILKSAFSTRWVVTQISGRGVGMDVVTTEIKQLSGTLHIHSKAGQGTWFEIRLPHSLTISTETKFLPET